MSLLLPSYKTGFARNAAESEYPNLWKDLVGVWGMSLGPTGLTVFDHSGKGNHVTLTNMDPATDWVPSPYGWALDFGGAAGEWVQTPWLPDMRTPLTTAVHAIMPSWGDNYLFGTHDGANRWYVGDAFSGVGSGSSAGLGFTAGAWKTWFLLCDGSNAWVFEDDTQKATFAYSASAASTVEFRLGARNHISNPEPLACTIDFAASWSRMLTASERSEIVDNPNAVLEPLSRIPALPAVGVTARPSYVIGGGIAV